MLLKGLPPNARLHGGWSLVEHHTASTVELLHHQLRLFIAANSEEGTELPEPLVIPRPGAEPDEPRNATQEEIDAFFGGASP